MIGRATLQGVVLAIALWALSPQTALAQCDSPADLAAVAATRALVDQQCNCDQALSHGLYVRCAARIANEQVGAGNLDPLCRKIVVKCAARSTCGKPPGLHPCCKTNRLGKVICKIRLPEQCRSGPGGSHCVSFTKKSCCDACVGLGCASPSGAFLDGGAAGS